MLRELEKEINQLKQMYKNQGKTLNRLKEELAENKNQTGLLKATYRISQNNQKQDEAWFHR